MGPLFLMSFASFPLVFALSHKLGNRTVGVGAALQEPARFKRLLAIFTRATPG